MCIHNSQNARIMEALILRFNTLGMPCVTSFANKCNLQNCAKLGSIRNYIKRLSDVFVIWLAKRAIHNANHSVYYKSV